MAFNGSVQLVKECFRKLGPFTFTASNGKSLDVDIFALFEVLFFYYQTDVKKLTVNSRSFTCLKCFALIGR